VPERARTLSPGKRTTIRISITYKGEAEIESVEAVFAREGSNGEIRLLGDVKREISGEGRRLPTPRALRRRSSPEPSPASTAACVSVPPTGSTTIGSSLKSRAWTSSSAWRGPRPTGSKLRRATFSEGVTVLRMAVIGAGIVGASVAFWLARSGQARVWVVDRLLPGSGATSASFAWVNANDKTPCDYFELNRVGLEEHFRLRDELPI
jgi:hypothetical protein